MTKAHQWWNWELVHLFWILTMEYFPPFGDAWLLHQRIVGGEGVDFEQPLLLACFLSWVNSRQALKALMPWCPDFFHIFFWTSDFAAPFPYFPPTHPRHWQWMPHLRFPIWKYRGEGHLPTCLKESTLPYPPTPSLPLPVSFSSESLALTKFINLLSVSHTEQQAGRGGNILYFIHCLLLGAWNTVWPIGEILCDCWLSHPSKQYLLFIECSAIWQELY